MFQLVPSEYMRKLLEEKGFTFTDFQKAALIRNAPGLSWKEKLEALREFAGQTKDEKLHRQIEERLWFEEEAFRRFKDNSAGRYVYVTVGNYETREESFGFFADYEMAKEHILKAIRENEDFSYVYYTIEKQVIVRDKSDLIVKDQARWNTYMFPEMAEEKEEYEEYDGSEVSSVRFDREGRISDFYKGEMSREEIMTVDEFNPERFEAPFFKIPFEAPLAAPVRTLSNPKGNYEDYGILLCDTNDWEKYMRDIEERQLYVDFSDVQVVVYFLSDYGRWSHEHINPLYLEIGVKPENVTDEREKAYVRAMEAFSEYWRYSITDAKTEEKTAALEKAAVQTAKAYRDVCREYDAQNMIQMFGVDESAETIGDIMF